MRNLSFLLLASLGACAWTEFDDLRDEAWVVAITKPEDSEATNWGVAMARGVGSSDSGGKLAIFGSAPSRQHDTTFDFKGKPTLLEQDLGDIGIANLAIEPIVIEDSTTDNFAIVTQGSSMAVVVGQGQGINLNQTVVNGADVVDAAVYILPPNIDTTQVRGSRVAGAGLNLDNGAQPLIASGDKLFGTFPMAPNSQFQQTHCQLVVNAIPISARALGAVRTDPTETTDDIAVWGDDGNMYILDGHIFNGHRSGVEAVAGVFNPADYLCPSTSATDVNGVLDPRAILGTPAPVNFSPAALTLGQILKIDDTHSILQGHGQSEGFLQLWDFATNMPVGPPVEESDLKAAAIYREGANVFVVAGFPARIKDGVSAGVIKIYPIDVATGILTEGVVELFDAQPEDGEAFGRSLAVFEFNGVQIIAVGANNEVFTYFRSSLYDETRQ